MAGTKIYSNWKKPSLYSMAFITFLCSLSYLLGEWQHFGSGGGTTGGAASATDVLETIRCTPLKNTTIHLSEPIVLDFLPHHEVVDPASTSPAEEWEYYHPCDAKYSEYTPCEDTERSLRFKRERLMYMDRHCPEKGEVLKCRVPAPYGYKSPFGWPASRDWAWYANVPHKKLMVEKAVQNWIKFEGDRFRFPGGGTMFRYGADAYIDGIGRLINLRDGSIRTAIDTGCGVASLGAFLLSRNILTMSFAPKDTHEAQVQFALEWGVPAMIGILASNRLPYPSRAFDMAHCSRCLIPWGQYDGLYLIEVDRILRPGGYWLLSGPPINWKQHWKGWERTREDLKAKQLVIETIAKSLCWKKLIEKSDIAVWQKPTNHIHCKINRKVFKNPQFCQTQDPDMAWYTKMESCLTPLPNVSNIKEIAGGQLVKWPERLNAVPPRISSGSVERITSEIFIQDTELWKMRLAYYKVVNNQLGHHGSYRNVLDMNSYLGGFAAALIDDPVWVMNVVPTEAKINTLGVIYERGLIGTYQNWCEAMSTYPRTYDLLHADSLFSLYDDRCEMEDILLEMDRILRPEGSVILRDDVDVLVKIKSITDKLKWNSQIVDHEDGPLKREKLLFAMKLYWTAPAPSPSQEGSKTTS